MQSPRPTVLDAAVVLWMVLCIVLGFTVADRVRDLNALPEAVSSVGAQVSDVGDAIGSIDVPLVGGQLDKAADEVRKAGERTRRQGLEAQDNVVAAASILGFAVAVVPIAPVLLIYAPLRWARLRERRALRELASEAEGDPLLERLLAHRALMTMSYHELAQLGGRPWAELSDGRYERLAEAEADRAGGLPERPS